jgi:hypothetical protein
MDFQKRNEIRQQQLDYKWIREVGDRVQLRNAVDDYPAWSSGTITKLTPGHVGFSIPYEFATVIMDDGGILEETKEQAGKVNPKLKLVPHECYFLSDEDKNA